VQLDQLGDRRPLYPRLWHEEQKQRWLPDMAKGLRIGAIAMTEPGAGSDLQNIRTRARRVEGGWRLSGQKTFISNGQTADLIVVVARTGDEGREGRFAPRRRNRRRRRISPRPQPRKARHACAGHVGAVLRRRVRARGNLLGVEGAGFGQLMHQLAWERMIIALDAVVNMERAVALTTDYVRERNAFGKALFDFQNTQFVLADAATQASVARIFVDTLMVRLLAGELDAATAAKAKYVDDRYAVQGDRCLPAAVRRLWLYDRISDRAAVRRRARQPRLRRRQ
jgi:acyl-CoA dehydrogenase